MTICVRPHCHVPIVKLTAASFIPGLDTVTNLLSIPVDIAKGDWVSAGFDLLGAIPIAGEPADLAKVGIKAGKTLDKASDAARVASRSPKGTNLLKEVSNPKLSNTIKEIYRPGAKVGDGGLSDAIRYEIRTGNYIGGKSHIQKVTERFKNLERILERETLTKREREIVEELINELTLALGGK